MNYKANVNKVAKKHGLTLKIISNSYGYHFLDDEKNGNKRNIYRCRLQRGRKSYTFDFGAAVLNPQIPGIYEVLSCLTKYDPESFENFCREYGYDEDSKNGEKIYKSVVKEYRAMLRLFDGEIPQDILDIN